jgi:hypothetical protein
MAEDWVPQPSTTYHEFANQFCDETDEKADVLGLSQTDKNGTESLRNSFNTAYSKAHTSATRGPAATVILNAARKSLTKQMRHIKRAYIEPGLENGLITLAQYIQFGLVPHDTQHTPKPDPVDHVDFKLSVDSDGRIVIAHYHITGSTSRGKGPYHAAEIRYWVRLIGDAAPVDPNEAGWHSVADTKSPWKKAFAGVDAGKRLYITMRWENNATGEGEDRGKGPWCTIQSVVIP